MTTKYIVFENSYAIVFPDFLEHKVVAAAIEQRLGDKPTSAGFVGAGEPTNDQPFFGYGESISLGFKSNPETDSKLLNKLLT